MQGTGPQPVDHRGMSLHVRRRWQILAKLFRDRKCDRHILRQDDTGAIVRFESFNFIKEKHVREEDECAWNEHILNTDLEVANRSISLRQLTGPIQLEELVKFNNTGNVCVWPAEEILAYYILRNLHYFQEKSVIELGGGMTCMAGIYLAVQGVASRVELTDGSPESVENLRHCVEANVDLYGKTRVDCRVLRWDEVSKQSSSAHRDLLDQFDYVISADCLFFDEFREDLAVCIHRVLKVGGEAIILAPKRGHTFDDFLEICRNKFSAEQLSCHLHEEYDEEVTKRAKQFLSSSDNFSPNKHYPLMIKLKKIS